MKKLHLALLAILFLVIACGPRKHRPAYTYSDRFEQADFREPTNAFRAVPFYSLNDWLDSAELCRQLGIFKEAGYGGAFLHSRIGLLTPYLSDNWFDMMNVGTSECQRLGIDAWYYDEDKWPSGFAGGIVPRQSDDYRARCLVRLSKGTAVVEPDRILWEEGNWIYVERVNPWGQPWYNGTSWVDLMNPDMVQAFIECSYKPYTDRYAGQPHALGIFTDEPQISAQPQMEHQGVVSYSPRLQTVFRELWGYELSPVLPSLFEETGAWRTVRLHYYRTLAHCMETAFSKPIADFCAAHNFIWTGHYNAEDNPRGNMRNEGALMQQLRHMPQPGIDALGLRYNSTHCGKVASSVANQYNRPRRLTELFGISGHNMSFEDRMWITSWHTIMGINFMCPHLYLYSMKGARKRDYPPTISHQQPYFGENKLFEDYSARLCYFASTGWTRAEVCVINPIESDYFESLDNIQHDLPRDKRYEALMNDILAAHRNFDMGDEQIISEIGTIEKGRLNVGRMAYPVVVVPDMVTIRESTLELLEELHEAGGTVILCGDYPTYVDGEIDDDLEKFKQYAKKVTRDELKSAIDAALSPSFRLSGEGAETIWSHLRDVKGGLSLQLSNTSRTETRRVQFSWGDPMADAMLWNPVNGECLSIESADGSYTLEFAPAQTWVLTAGKPSRDAKADGAYVLPGDRTEILTLGRQWRPERLDPNAITLDYASVSKDGGRSWSEPEPIQAFYTRSAAYDTYNGPLQVKFTVKIDQLPASCALVMEQPEMYRSIRINGEPVEFTGDGFYRDAVFRTQPITPLLRPGNNEILLSLDYITPIPASYDAVERYGTEVEAIYLIGDFGVSGTKAGEPLLDTWRNQQEGLPKKPAVNRYGAFTLTAEPAAVSGDLATQGYPFYAGRFALSQTFTLQTVDSGSRYLLTFPEFEAILIGVNVNGTNFPTVFCSPWEADITSALQPGENRVTLTLTNSLRNLMGPHHHMGGEFSEVGPATFEGSSYWPNKVYGEADWYDARKRPNPILWREAYHVIPFGLLAPPVLEEQRD